MEGTSLSIEDRKLAALHLRRKARNLAVNGAKRQAEALREIADLILRDDNEKTIIKLSWDEITSIGCSLIKCIKQIGFDIDRYNKGEHVPLINSVRELKRAEKDRHDLLALYHKLDGACKTEWANKTQSEGFKLIPYRE